MTYTLEKDTAYILSVNDPDSLYFPTPILIFEREKDRFIEDLSDTLQAIENTNTNFYSVGYLNAQGENISVCKYADDNGTATINIEANTREIKLSPDEAQQLLNELR